MNAYKIIRHSGKNCSWLILIMVLGFFALCMNPVTAAVSEKTATAITISVDPSEPQKGEGFTVTGVLKTADGELLGNKYVYLDSTMAGAEHGTLQPLWQTKTSTTGTYSFYRPPQSPAEDLRVRFDGNYRYQNCTSDLISVHK